MPAGTSYRRILRSSSIIGGASIINILVGLLRTKVAAMLLGPAGIGVIGLLQNLVATASTFSALGIDSAGTRKIAEIAERSDEHELASARRALFFGTVLLALVGGGVFWLMRAFLAEHLLHGMVSAPAVGWLAIGVALMVVAASQTALLNGMQRIGDLARVSIATAVMSTLLALGALWLWGHGGIVPFVLAIPLASFACGLWYVAKLPRIRDRTPTPVGELATQYADLIRVGSAFMIGAFVELGGLLVVRMLLERRLGSEALGHFQASWMITMTYIGFVLGAMGKDFYPRLSAKMNDSVVANRLINEQTEMALLLAAPVIVAMLGLAPWIIRLLYSDQFDGAAIVLRWQILGDVLKIASWPLAFVMLAAGNGRAFVVAQSIGICVFIGLTWAALRLVGIQAAGISFLCMYLVYFPMVFLFARRQTGFRFSARVSGFMLITLGAAGCAFLMGSHLGSLGVGIDLAMAICLAVYCAARVSHMAELTGIPGRIGAGCRCLMVKAGVWRE